jgi:hypothetical protein
MSHNPMGLQQPVTGRALPFFLYNYCNTRLPLWSSDKFLATDPGVPGSIPGPTTFSGK